MRYRLQAVNNRRSGLDRRGARLARETQPVAFMCLGVENEARADGNRSPVNHRRYARLCVQFSYSGQHPR